MNNMAIFVINVGAKYIHKALVMFVLYSLNKSG